MCYWMGILVSDIFTETPFGGLPMLDYNGLVIAQSIVVARFLARKFNLAGKTPEEEARADMIVDCVNDVINAKWAEDKFKNETLPNALKNFEKLLKDNGGKYFVGNDLTWADIRFAAALEGKFVDAKWPQCLKDHICSVMSLPKIKAWVEKRPKTEF